MTWHPGPPPDGTEGLLLVVLDATAVKEFFSPAVAEYYAGNPVACRWWGHKGKDTFGSRTISPLLVVRWAELQEVA